MSENMKFWNGVERSDPDDLGSPKTLGGYTFTPIKPYRIFKKATELWGPEGEKWGVKLALGATAFISYTPDGKMAVFEGILYSPLGEIPIVNSTKTVSNKGVPFDNFAKIVKTGAMTKGFSHWGFNADVYLNMMEDDNYAKDMELDRKRSDASKTDALNKKNIHKKMLVDIMTQVKEEVPEKDYRDLFEEMRLNQHKGFMDTAYVAEIVTEYIRKCQNLLPGTTLSKETLVPREDVNV